MIVHWLVMMKEAIPRVDTCIFQPRPHRRRPPTIIPLLVVSGSINAASKS